MRKIITGFWAFVLALLLILPAAALADMQARFIDVGQGDACLITCDGETMLIDGGMEENGPKIVELLDELCIDELKYAVNTHPHDDHVGGMTAVLEAINVKNIYSSTTDYDKNDFVNFKNAAAEKGLEISTLKAGDALKLGSADINVLGPVEYMGDLNNDSIVLKVIYGNTSLLLTGDAEQKAERAMIDSGANLSATLLKVGHHGASTSSGDEFLYEVMPTYAVISVGEGNSYGHPTPDTINRLSDMGCLIFRTDIHGTLNVMSDGKFLTLSAEKNLSAAQENVKDEANDTEYIGNKNSKKFHLPNCYTLPAEKNRVYFDSRDEAIDAGYDPCKNCDP